jgi:predicted amidohydrolase YtcJ
VPTESAADFVLRGGAVHTVDPTRPRAEAVAVRDGRIVAVGSDREVGARIGPRTRVIELRGRTLLPGFQDAHCHPCTSGLDQLRCDLLAAHGKAEVSQTIAAYVAAHPDDPWVVGSGWYMADFPHGTPHRRDLDTVVGDRPAYFENRDGHSAWVSTRALALAGIGASTPDPDGGRIERETDGSPTGALHEAAMDLVLDLIPPATPEERERGLLGAQRFFHSLGITAWQDASVRPACQAAYEALAGRGELTARVVGAMTFEAGWDVDAIDGLVERRARGPVGRFAATSVKFFLDGVLETFTGAMLEPYLAPDGGPADRMGMLVHDPQVLRRAVVAVDAAGFQVHMHAIGDRAVREGLDAIEGALAANGPTKGRHHIAHIQVIQPVDVARFGPLGVVANAQALWACHDPQLDELTNPFLGPERTAMQYPFGSLLRAGARLAMGSDWGVSTPNVFDEMHVAVERSHPSLANTEPFLPEEAITLDQAVHAFTMGAAYVNHLDEVSGSLTPGKLADLVVVDRDLWDRPSGPISDARAIATFVEGEAVFEDPALGG